MERVGLKPPACDIEPALRCDMCDAGGEHMSGAGRCNCTLEPPGRRDVLIVGASRGIGFAVARAFLVAPPYTSHVHATVRRHPDNNWLRAMCEGDGLDAIDCRSRLHLHKVDVTDEAGVRTFARTLKGARLAVVVHSAGVNRGSYDEQVRINAQAPFATVQALLDNGVAMKRVAIVTSEVGTLKNAKVARERCGERCEKRRACGRHWNASCPYGLSKQLANQRFREVEPAWRRRGSIAIALHPGFVDTDMNRGKGSQPTAIPAARSARGIWRVFNNLRWEHAGKFLNYQGKDTRW